MGCGLGESGQDIQNRIMFITRWKCKFGIPTNGPLREFWLFARIVEQVINIIFGWHVMATGRQLEFPKELLLVLIWRFLALRPSALCHLGHYWGGELIFISCSWWNGSRKSKTSKSSGFWTLSRKELLEHDPLSSSFTTMSKPGQWDSSTSFSLYQVWTLHLLSSTSFSLYQNIYIHILSTGYGPWVLLNLHLVDFTAWRPILKHSRLLSQPHSAHVITLQIVFKSIFRIENVNWSNRERVERDQTYSY